MMNATVERDESSSRGKAALEREGEEIRADMDRTLDALERKFSPEQWVDRSMEFLRENGADFVHEVGETIRSNPVPVLLTGAGLLWLLSSVSGSRMERPARRSERQRTRRERHLQADASASDRSSVDRVKDRVKDRVRDSMQGMQDRTATARSNFATMVQEQPLAFGAVAVATGALIGAALPMTQYESRVVGPVHDRTLSKAGEVGRRQYEKVRDTLASDSGSNQEGDTLAPSAASQH